MLSLFQIRGMWLSLVGQRVKKWKNAVGSRIKSYFVVWTDEVWTTHEEPGGTAGVGTRILSRRSPPSSSHTQRAITWDASYSCIMWRETCPTFLRLLTPSLLTATLIAYWQFKRRSWSERCVTVLCLHDVTHKTYTYQSHLTSLREIIFVCSENSRKISKCNTGLTFKPVGTYERLG